jgi:hypothetical protein
LTLEHLDGRTAAARRARDVVAAIESDLGGRDYLTEAERQIVRRAAVLAVICESNEAAWLQGGEIDLGSHGASANTLRRLLECVGMSRRSRDLTPSLASYVAQRS